MVHFGLARASLPSEELTAIKEHLKKRKLDQALIPPGDRQRLRAVLPHTEFDYTEAKAEHPNQMQPAAARDKVIWLQGKTKVKSFAEGP